MRQDIRVPRYKTKNQLEMELKEALIIKAILANAGLILFEN